MTSRFLAAGAVVLTILGYPALSMADSGPNVLVPQKGLGAKFQARDPYTCSSTTEPKTGPVSADLARQYLICKIEQVNGAGLLFLLDNVKIEVGKPIGKARDVLIINHDADPDGLIYPIRGSYDQYICFAVDHGLHRSGQNCSVTQETHAKGDCHRTSFGDWSCYMDGMGPSLDGRPPPGYVVSGGGAPAAIPQSPNKPAKIAPISLTTNWSSATSKLPPVTSSAKQTVTAQLSASDTNVQQGMNLFEHGDYRGAYQKFHAAVQQNMNDPLPQLWEGVTLEVLKTGGISFDFLAGGTDPRFAVISSELLALSSWSHGELGAAKIDLENCIRYHPDASQCADMKQGVESGASAPDAKDWPADVGLIKATEARGTVWKPKG